MDKTVKIVKRPWYRQAQEVTEDGMFFDCVIHNNLL
jgi:hypothetical protein